MNITGGEVVYQAPDGAVRVDARLEREMVWLTRQQMADLFGRKRSVVTRHVRNVFKEGKLERESNELMIRLFMNLLIGCRE